jgi:parvulin-like peptidyl-prolyl isomerase
VSPDKGRKGTSGRGGSGSAAGPAATRRLGLLIFGVAFVVLFAWVAIADGVGDPSIPSGDVALVEDVPGDAGKISEEMFKHQLELTARQGGEKEAPKPGSAKYGELKETAINALFEAAWLQGQGDEWGIEVSDKEVAAELKKIKKENFKTKAEFKEFLDESGYTPADIDERVKIQIISQKLQEQLKEKAPTPSQSDVEDYYEAAKSTQFTQEPTRDVRMIVNQDRKKAEQAQEALNKDDSAQNWSKVAKQYSEDPTTKEKGGLQQGLPEGTVEEPLNEEIFNAPEGRIEGPIKAQRGYTVFEVENSTPGGAQELKAVESQIQSTLAQRFEQEYFTGFVSSFNTQWTQRTFCASDYMTERCANFESSGHPSTAPAGCYEADPKGGRPEACPAPVFQLVPAMPGTVTVLEPRGKPLAQRPQPLGETGKGGNAATGLPEGAAPPTEAPPTEAPPSEAPSE